MKKNKLLVLVTTDTLVEKIKEESNITFLFPVTSFCVGFPKTFKVEKLPDNSYIFINRILDDAGIAEFKKLMDNLPQNIKGIVFDDIGILNILNVNKNIEKILYLNHMNCNYMSVTCFLDYVDSVVVSTDITKDEIKDIIKITKKPLVIHLFGHINIMYSRRNLLSNYGVHFNESIKSIETLEETNSKHKIKAVENSYGTVIYTNEPFNNLDLKDEDMLYGLINTIFLTDEEVIEIINSKNNMKDKYPYTYLSEEETIYKLKEDAK